MLITMPSVRVAATSPASTALEGASAEELIRVANAHFEGEAAIGLGGGGLLGEAGGGITEAGEGLGELLPLFLRVRVAFDGFEQALLEFPGIAAGGGKTEGLEAKLHLPELTPEDIGLVIGHHDTGREAGRGSIGDGELFIQPRVLLFEALIFLEGFLQGQLGFRRFEI